MQADIILERLWTRYQKFGQSGKTLNIKLKYNDFTQITRSTTKINRFISKNSVEETGKLLMEQVLPLSKPIRLIGFQISGFQQETDEIATQMTMDF
jgi:DNA polymerase-4